MSQVAADQITLQFTENADRDPLSMRLTRALYRQLCLSAAIAFPPHVPPRSQQKALENQQQENDEEVRPMSHYCRKNCCNFNHPWNWSPEVLEKSQKGIGFFVFF